jgi:phosphopentomutase
MTATAILVIDGFGIGAMPDAGALRSTDVEADTLGSLAKWAIKSQGRPIKVGNMMGAGMAALRPDLVGFTEPATRMARGRVTVRKSALGYPGADTFAGHQTMMGADMSNVTLCRVGERIPELTEALKANGHKVELLNGVEKLLVVDEVALVHDNLEADPALNWNVSARLDEISWEEILEISKIVRRVAPVARVIAVGGYSDRPLSDSVRPGPGNTIGLDTPASGFYKLGGLQVLHMGVEIDHTRQLPQAVSAAGFPVTLVGKAADILVASGADVYSKPGVDTKGILEDTLIGIQRGGLTVANVQQTDLAGHQQDVKMFASIVEQVDAALPELVRALGSNGVLVITGDHGNDPDIGHAFHTREYVPVIAINGRDKPTDEVESLEDMSSLAEVGASVAARFGLRDDVLANGKPREL